MKTENENCSKNPTTKYIVKARIENKNMLLNFNLFFKKSKNIKTNKMISHIVRKLIEEADALKIFANGNIANRSIYMSIFSRKKNDPKNTISAI